MAIRVNHPFLSIYKQPNQFTSHYQPYLKFKLSKRYKKGVLQLKQSPLVVEVRPKVQKNQCPDLKKQVSNSLLAVLLGIWRKVVMLSVLALVHLSISLLFLNILLLRFVLFFKKKNKKIVLPLADLLRFAGARACWECS